METETKPDAKYAVYAKYRDALDAMLNSAPVEEFPQFKDALVDVLLPSYDEDETEGQAYLCMMRSVIYALIDHAPDEHGLVECNHICNDCAEAEAKDEASK